MTNERFFVTNGALGRIDIFEPSGMESIDPTALEGFAGVESVPLADGVVAAAIARASEEETVDGETIRAAQPGFIALFGPGRRRGSGADQPDQPRSRRTTPTPSSSRAIPRHG